MSVMVRRQGTSYWKVVLMLQVVALLAAPPARATEKSPIEPLAGIEQISINVEIGDAIRIDDAAADPLFAGSREEAQVFVAELRERLAARLQSLGINVEDGASDVFSVTFFGGHSAKIDCDDRAAFLLEVSLVTDSDHEDGPTERYARRRVGMALARHPQEKLTAAMIKLFEQDLVPPESIGPGCGESGKGQ